jgi:hypothetical protein
VDFVPSLCTLWLLFYSKIRLRRKDVRQPIALTHDIWKTKGSFRVNKTFPYLRAAAISSKSILSDSARTIRSLKAKFWHEKLQHNDKLLEEERVRIASVWNSKTFWFTVGGLTASVVYLTR